MEHPAAGSRLGIIEEGVALQSLFNPDMYGGLAAWGGRAFGVNGLYAELIIPLHAIWSVAIPILLTDVLFPERRSVPYLGCRGLAITSSAYILGVGLVWLSALAQTGFFPSSNQLGAAVLLAIVLGVAGLTLPHTSGGRRRDTTAPRPWALFGAATPGTFAFIGPLLLLGKAQLGFMQSPLVALLMLGALLVLFVLSWMIYRWSRAPDFGDRHLVALGSGAIVAHSLCGDIAFSRSLPDTIARLVLLLIAVALLSWLARRVRVTDVDTGLDFRSGDLSDD